MKSRAGILLSTILFVTSIMEGKAAESPKARQAEPVGKSLYQKHCSICHGSQGRGDGHAAFFMAPKPRDFTSGLFKLRSTPSGQPPLDNDLLTAVTRGMPGSLMPSFEPLSDRERKELVAYIKALTVTEPGGKNIFELKRKAIVIPREPKISKGSTARGKELYKELGCDDCHGEKGEGNGPSANDLKDQWGYAIQPTDFTRGVFKGGAEGKEIYKRIAIGMEGTPMPAYGDAVLSGKDRWAVVHYIKTFPPSF